jgi:DmsE family decaheme c-type cytochrome
MLTAALFALAVSAGSADCATCHEDVVKSFAFAPHATACAACHEVEPEHLESPSKETVRRTPSADTCRSCHAGRRDAHARQGVACLACHASGHAGKPVASAAGCATCHAAQRASFERPFAHREGRKALACTECHTAHGERMQTSRVCVQCHTELAGPRVFEHRALQVSGCLGCHESHGSANARLLKRRDVASLCLECHTNTPQFHDLTQAKYRGCVNCHVAVHGSNRDAHLFDD